MQHRWFCTFTATGDIQASEDTENLSTAPGVAAPRSSLPPPSPPHFPSHDVFHLPAFLICALSWGVCALSPPLPPPPLTHQQHRDQTTSNLRLPPGLNLKCIAAVTRHSERATNPAAAAAAWYGEELITRGRVAAASFEVY